MGRYNKHPAVTIHKTNNRKKGARGLYTSFLYRQRSSQYLTNTKTGTDQLDQFFHIPSVRKMYQIYVRHQLQSATEGFQFPVLRALALFAYFSSAVCVCVCVTCPLPTCLCNFTCCEHQHPPLVTDMWNTANTFEAMTHWHSTETAFSANPFCTYHAISRVSVFHKSCLNCSFLSYDHNLATNRWPFYERSFTLDWIILSLDLSTKFSSSLEDG